MPQSPLAAATAVNPSGKFVMNVVDATGNEYVASGKTAVYNITTATVVKATPGRLVRISVIVAGSAAGTANDCATTGAAAVGNQITVIPNTVGPMQPIDWPCATGVVVVPGTGQTLAVSYI
jgi:hypothetical protein